MVSTRRSGQRSETPENPQGSGPSTSSARGRGRGRGGSRAAAHKTEQRLDPIEEDTAHHADQQQQAAADEPGPSQAPAEQQRVTAPAGAHTLSSKPAQEQDAGAASRGVAAPEPDSEPSTSGSDGEDGYDGSDSDDDLLGPNLMGALASSLREALTARGGPRAASPKPEGQRHQRSSAGASTSTDAAKLGLDSDPNAIQWRPPNIKKAPELVSAPQRVAPGAGASKEKGLAKQLLVPPRANSPPPASAAEASKRWAELPATKITEEVKTELRLLRLRGAYDPKRFYKSFDETKFPKHFQIGTVLDSPGEFYSSRLTQRERGATITQEILADPSIEHARRKRYAKLQAEAVKHHRVKKRKTDLKRANNKPKRQKH